MEKHAEDARRKAMVIDIDMLVPKDHLLRKIEKVMDYDWLYERLNPLYNDKVGRPGTDPVVLIKMVLIQHLFGIPSLRQTWRECDVNVAYRWFLGYDLLEHIPHFATVSYAKEKHSMRYTHMRGLTRVTQWVRLKFAAMNLKKLANWAWKRLCLQAFGKYFWIFEAADGCCAA